MVIYTLKTGNLGASGYMQLHTSQSNTKDVDVPWRVTGSDDVGSPRNLNLMSTEACSTVMDTLIEKQVRADRHVLTLLCRPLESAASFENGPSHLS